LSDNVVAYRERDLPSPGRSGAGARSPDCSRGGRRLWARMLVLFVLLGIGCRLRQYLVRTSFWNDEAFIVLNIVDHPASWMLGPLDYNQAAPPVFLWIERAAFLALGSNEYALRLFPLIAGLTSLVLFALLAWRVIPGPAAVFAVGWYAFAQKLIIYCAEVKQYSSDALIAVILILLAVGGGRVRPASARFMLIAMVSAAAVWLSHPTVIVFGALSLGLALPCWREGGRGRVSWVGGNLLMLASFAALYRLSIVREQDPFLYQFWSQLNGFPPTDHLMRIPRWLGEQLYELCRQPYPVLPVLTALLAVLGIIEFGVRKTLVPLVCCAVPIVLAVAAAFDHKYPFSPSRLTIYLLPGLLLLCGAGAAFLLNRWKRPLCFLAWVLPGVMLGFAGSAAVSRVVHPQFRSHIRPVVQYIRSHYRAGDTIYLLGLPGQRHLEFFCYWRDPPPPIFHEFPAAGQLPTGRFWIVFTFAPGHPTRFMPPILASARSMAQEKDRLIVNQGGAAYLFDRGGSGHLPVSPIRPRRPGPS
jgi:4-amino-4-deoxy-L-arabinose transferase-like glycosyltransferase